MANAFGDWRHLCIDMQRMFGENTSWHVDWMGKILPQVEAVVAKVPEKTVFTRFIPPQNADHAHGAWRPYYRKWAEMTLDNLPPHMLDIIPALSRVAPSAGVFDKSTYSPWIDGRLHRQLQDENVTTLAVTGGETDVCVLATVLGAIDLGYRVIVLSDGICSGADETHDATLKLLGNRFTVQLEIVTTETFLDQIGSGGPCCG
ncbi:cysteine hydrolase [Neorhizobium sp. LMR1-1-1.1]